VADDAGFAELAFVMLLVFGSVILGSVLSRKQLGAKRLAFLILPPLLTAALIALAVGGTRRSTMAGNETAAAAACKAYAEAQEIYHRTDRDGDGVFEYATSVKALRAALAGAGANAGIDQRLADAEWGLNARPWRGYYFKVLTAQSVNAGVARSYLVNGNMTLGHALIAWPARHDRSGRNVFVISHGGTIFAANWGQDSASLAAGTVEFDPSPKKFPCSCCDPE
jgi:hypothetical protein